MPTSRPRLTVTLTPELDRALSAFATATGQSKGSIVLECLQPMAPGLQRAAVRIQAVNRMRPEAIASLKAASGRLEAFLDRTAEFINTGLDLFGAEPESASEHSEGAESGSVSGSVKGMSPPLPNRGGEKRSAGGKVTSIRRKNRV